MLAEGRPRVGPGSRLALRLQARPRGERLVQPQVVPPRHGDQVAEPHVRHLVQDGLGPQLVLGGRHPRPEDVVLEERHRTGVLHRPGLVLGHEDLVVLAERVPHPERGMEIIKALPGDLEHLVRIQVASQGLPAVQAERDAVVLGPDAVVRPGGDMRNVRRHHRRGREVPALDPWPGWLAVGVRGHVRDHLPGVRAEHRELESRLEVRLIEARVDPVRVEGLQVRVQVDALVRGVGEPVQPFSAARVGAARRDGQLVVASEAGQRDPVPVERGQRQLPAIQADLSNSRRGEINKRFAPRTPAGEAHRRHRAERCLVAGQVERDLIALGPEQPGAPGRFVAGQVVRHGDYPLGRPERPPWHDFTPPRNAGMVHRVVI